METRGIRVNGQPYFTVRRLSMLAALTALCHVGRLLFQVIPNVQPMTTILLLIALTIGTVDGMIVAGASLVISNIYLGMGPWTIYQLFTYLLIMVLTGAMRPLYRKLADYPVIRRIIFAVYALLVGFLYGFIISIFSARMYGVSNFLVYYLQGVSFDVLHAVGNAGFFIILEPILVPLMTKRQLS